MSSQISSFLSLGPEPLDDEFTLEDFQIRIRKHPEEIKNLLINQGFLAGVGNAYADEILSAAGIFPFRKRPSLRPKEVERLYHSMKTVLSEAIQTINDRIGEQNRT
ncbi:MAG TPA: Fpg/Nei family DNA glycosylase, partial [Firmicutes bacterium]|nr:Fpg/Nei family DNA glycosylase [Bacillota bacterium]